MLKRVCKGISATFSSLKKKRKENIPQTMKGKRQTQVETLIKLGITHNALI